MTSFCTILAVVILLKFNTINSFRNENKVNAENGSKEESKFKEINSSICKERVCVAKCCPFNKYVIGVKKCGDFNFSKVNLDFSDMELYNEERTKVVSTVNRTMHLIPAKFDDKEFLSKTIGVWLIPKISMYLTERGDFYIKVPNLHDKWRRWNANEICIDYNINKSAPYKEPIPRVWIVNAEEPKQTCQISSYKYLATYGKLISSIFLLLVFVVYALLPDLRNMGGKILMAYVFSLFWAYFLLFIIQVDRLSQKMCYALTLFDYFFFLSSFCWMNIMSYDIWTSFRGFANFCVIYRRGERNKYRRYCLYAWGIPLAMTIFVVIMDLAPLQRFPWIITPQITTTNCFLSDYSLFLYLYIPMVILILTNWLLYLMTAFSVWKLTSGTKVLNATAADGYQKQSRRFTVYVKLSVVMGLSWVFEIASWLSPEFGAWNITDVYNAVLGFTIFLIFVCKEKIFEKLKNRFSAPQPDKTYSCQYTKNSEATI